MGHSILITDFTQHHFLWKKNTTNNGCALKNALFQARSTEWNI
jgi:hypothetical protein